MLAASAAGLGFACKALSPDLDAVIAIEVTLPDSSIYVGDTVRPQGKALNGRGDSTGATIVWTALDTTIRVLDSLAGTTVGVSAGTGRLLARVGSLRSNPVAIRVLAALDSIVAVGPTLDSVFVSTPDSLSDSLEVKAFSAGAPAGGQRIGLSIDFPPGGGGVTLVPKDTVSTDASSGIAVFQVRLTGVRPDSAVISASATRSNGTPVRGSPIRFVVVFVP